MKTEEYLLDDIHQAMKRITTQQPILNDSSFPLVLLWRIFEQAEDSLEHYREVSKLSDNELEAAFFIIFPCFIKDYPAAMILDDRTYKPTSEGE